MEVWALCFLTHEIHKNYKDYFNFKNSLPLLRKLLPACAVQVLLQLHNAVSKNWPCIHFYGPFDPQVLSVNSAGKKSCRLHRNVGGEKEFVLLAAPGKTYPFMGQDSTHILCIAFILPISYMLKKSIFTTAVSLSSYPEFRLIVIITCNTIELKYIFITEQLLEFTCLLQH